MPKFRALQRAVASCLDTRLRALSKIDQSEISEPADARRERERERERR